MFSTDRFLEGFSPHNAEIFVSKGFFCNLKAHTQAKIIKKSVILFWLLNMAI